MTNSELAFADHLFLFEMQYLKLLNFLFGYLQTKSFKPKVSAIYLAQNIS